MEKQIEGVISSALQALLEKDAGKLGELLHPRFLYYPPTSGPLTREEFLADFTSDEMHIRMAAPADLHIAPNGISATASHDLKGEYRWMDLGGEREYRLTHTLVRNSEMWKIVATSVRPLRPELEYDEDIDANFAASA